VGHTVRRIVTGHDPSGRSVVVSDGPPPRTLSADEVPGLETFIVWASDAPLTVPHADGDPTPMLEAFFPGPGGTRFLVVVHPPGSGVTSAPLRTEDGRAGLSVAMTSDESMMHATDTVDYGVVLSGRMWMELDDGAEVAMGPGDCVVQNGTWHGWRNRGDEPCVMAFVVVGAERAG
jgi:mannose-6-phosphate isomerase-like protein (cupin superfamily)